MLPIHLNLHAAIATARRSDVAPSPHPYAFLVLPGSPDLSPAFPRSRTVDVFSVVHPLAPAGALPYTLPASRRGSHDCTPAVKRSELLRLLALRCAFRVIPVEHPYAFIVSCFRVRQLLLTVGHPRLHLRGWKPPRFPHSLRINLDRMVITTSTYLLSRATLTRMVKTTASRLDFSIPSVSRVRMVKTTAN